MKVYATPSGGGERIHAGHVSGDGTWIIVTEDLPLGSYMLSAGGDERTVEAVVHPDSEVTDTDDAKARTALGELAEVTHIRERVARAIAAERGTRRKVRFYRRGLDVYEERPSYEYGNGTLYASAGSADIAKRICNALNATEEES